MAGVLVEQEMLVPLKREVEAVELDIMAEAEALKLVVQPFQEQVVREDLPILLLAERLHQQSVVQVVLQEIIAMRIIQPGWLWEAQAEQQPPVG